MKEINFSIPSGTRELSFGITNEDGELWGFYMVFIDSVVTNSREVIVYGDFEEDGSPIEVRSGISKRSKGYDNEFELEFDMPETVKFDVYMCDDRYMIYVNY